MSITFEIQNGPTETQTYECCDWDGCPCCKGTGATSYEVPKHSLNLANGNAMAILRTIGLEADYCGEVPAEDVPEVLRRVIKARNTSKVNSEVRGTVVSHGGRFIECGIDTDYIVDRLDRLAEILRLAAELRLGFVWA